MSRVNAKLCIDPETGALYLYHDGGILGPEAGDMEGAKTCNRCHDLSRTVEIEVEVAEA